MRSQQLGAMLVYVLCCVICRGDEAAKSVEKSDRTPENAFAIEASHDGLFKPGRLPWTLVIDERGRAALTVKGLKSQNRQFSVDQKKVAQLRKVIEESDFFTLPETVGRPIFDSSTRTMTVQIGTKKKTVKIEYLSGPELSPEERRALSVWVEIRDLFENKFAIDSRPADKQLLDPKQK